MLTTFLWLLQEVVGVLLDSFKALAKEALGVPVLRPFAFFPQRILLGLSCCSTVSQIFLSEVERQIEAIYNQIDELIMTSPGHWGRGAYNEF